VANAGTDLAGLLQELKGPQVLVVGGVTLPFRITRPRASGSHIPDRHPGRNFRLRYGQTHLESLARTLPHSRRVQLQRLLRDYNPDQSHGPPWLRITFLSEQLGLLIELFNVLKDAAMAASIEKLHLHVVAANWN